MSVYRAWAEERAQLAESLGRGALGGCYADGAIILTSAIGALASLMWIPSSREDRKRFVEIVVRSRTCAVDAARVSIPLLAAKFPHLGEGLGISDESLYLTGHTDKSEADIRRHCASEDVPDNIREVRLHSYASLMYEQIRCGFVHEYRPGNNATERDDLRICVALRNDEISYANKLIDQNGRLVTKRFIYFPLQWIRTVLLEVSTLTDAESARLKKGPFENLGQPIPQTWWVDGG